jgi:hypothetical protein
VAFQRQPGFFLFDPAPEQSVQLYDYFFGRSSIFVFNLCSTAHGDERQSLECRAARRRIRLRTTPIIESLKLVSLEPWLDWMASRHEMPPLTLRE